MISSKLRVTKSGWDAPGGVKCQRPELAEYLGAGAQCDRLKGRGQAYRAVPNGNAAGHMVPATGNAGAERQADLDIDAYGPVPALVIAHLAVDERCEKQGVGKAMASYAIALAGKTAPRGGAARRSPTRNRTQRDSAKRRALPSSTACGRPGPADSGTGSTGAWIRGEEKAGPGTRRCTLARGAPRRARRQGGGFGRRKGGMRPRAAPRLWAQKPALRHLRAGRGGGVRPPPSAAARCPSDRGRR